MGLFFFVFWFSLILFCFFGFSYGFCWFLKAFGKTTTTTTTTHKTNPYPRVGLKPLNTFVGFPEGFLVFFGFLLYFWFSRRFFWFSLVFFGIFGFPEGFFDFLKTIGKTKQKNHGFLSDLRNFRNFRKTLRFWILVFGMLFAGSNRQDQHSPLQQCLASLCGFLHGFI